MKTKLFPVVLIFAAACLAGCAALSESTDQYHRSVQEIHEGRTYFAVMHLKYILKDDPQSPYAPPAAFGLGEYYFDNNDYFNSVKTLSDYIRNYPKHKGVVFAKLIIYKIITNLKAEDHLGAEEDALIEEIRKELFSQPLFLMFYDRKAPRTFKSLFNNSYLVYDYVDKIKVFRNDKIFLELTP